MASPISESQNNSTTELNQAGANGIPLAGIATIPPAAYATYLAYERNRRIRAMRASGPDVMPEPAEWLDRNFTLKQAYDAHQARWFGPQNEAVLKILGAGNHDAAHIILALSGAPIYQADLGAELHVIAIQQALHRPLPGSPVLDAAALLTPRGYVDVVTDGAKGLLGLENMTRTLTWIMGGRTNQTMDAAYRSYGTDGEKLVEAAKQHGVTVEVDFENGEFIWKIEIDNRVRYTYKYGDPAITELPRGTNGVEEFRPFEVPARGEILSVFNKVQPVLHDLQAKIHAIAPETVDGATLVDLLGDMHVSTIHKRMNGGTVPLAISPEARLNAQRAYELSQQNMMIAVKETLTVLASQGPEPAVPKVSAPAPEAVVATPPPSEPPKPPPPKPKLPPVDAPPVPSPPKLPPEAPPLPKSGKISTPNKIGLGGAGAQLALGGVIEAGLAAANDGSLADVGKASLHGLANGALPGVTDGFKNITDNNAKQNWLDQALNAGTTITQGAATAGLVVAGGAAVAAPFTVGVSLGVAAGSLVVAGVAGVANIGIGVVHDIAYVAGASKQGGLVTGLVDMAGQFVDSKAGQRVSAWMKSDGAQSSPKTVVTSIIHDESSAADIKPPPQKPPVSMGRL